MSQLKFSTRIRFPKLSARKKLPRRIILVRRLHYLLALQLNPHLAFKHFKLILLRLIGCHQDHRQNMPRRRQPGQDVPRDLHPEAPTPSAHHATLRGDGVKELDLSCH
jgi:hypothetical protein